MYDDFGYMDDLGTMYDGGYGDDMAMGYDDMAYYKPMKVPKATPKNVKEEISMILGCYPQDLKFEMLDELPQCWRHACYNSGIVQVEPVFFEFYDGSIVYYTICPFFPECNKVHVYVERNYV